MKNRGIAFLALGITASMALSGCGSDGNSGANGGGNAGGTSNTANAGDAASNGGGNANAGAADNGGGDKKVELRIGTWEGGDGLKIQQQIADNYKKTHGNVSISIESVPDQYGTKILTQIAAGQAPDIFQIGDGDVSMFMKKGALEDLTTYIGGANGINTGDYYQSVLDVGKLDGKYYTMPKDYSDIAVFYNKKMFDDAGVAYPQAGWTWDQFYDTAKKLTKKDGDKYTQWGVSLPGSWIRAVLPLIQSYGGSVISPDGEKIDGYMNSDGTVKALELYQDMYQKDHISPSNTDSEAFKGVDLFAAGKVAMNMTGRWPAEDYKKNADLQFGVVQMPVGPAGAANTICYSGYGLYSKSKNKDAAWDYLKYLTGPEGQELMAQHAFTAVKSTAEKLGQTNDPALKAFLDDVPNIKDFPEKISPFFGVSGGKSLQTVMDKMMLGKPIDVKKELDAAAKQGDADLQTAKNE
ncbi:sugar ABC transporter substrate-binding protein [Paenibacillus sp. MWE-103]|uniref:Sugar ABC transporter substrate-binding protein n=1 Tax=Paenibacillus artemisiicola TaxID=1172618 RepID=A0ABS3WKL1_9BACL|nr:sugar ABC transporter substrate-binding protein [Paenibacillus artemisiicola]MBO7748861.1 sugar ABC transporter substrate-binding protein [Paenibacillus artemisiicola]